jgi:NAD(P)H-hydrate epimerase
MRMVEIGIPDGGPEGLVPAAGRICAAVLDEVPLRQASSTKFSSGQVVIVGGSRGLTGAPCMAAEAAIRAGAGYATVAVPEDLEPIFEVKLTEVMSAACPGPPGRLGPDSLEPVLAACRRAAAVLLGPGLGREPGTLTFAREFAARLDRPLVIDADGLAAFNGADLERLAGRGPTILTPHEGELARLLEIESDAVSARRLACVREVARRTGAVVVLKGDDTIVADGEEVAVNALAAPGLATAGTGDVLAGASAALLARVGDPFLAAAAAVYAHARAGRVAAERIGLAESVIAGDVIAALPTGLRR